MLHQTFGDSFSHGIDHPVRDLSFEPTGGVRATLHQVGGYAYPLHFPLEYGLDAGEPDDWVLLAQFDSDGRARMHWGDCGLIYWLIRRQDLAARRFDRAAFTLQCY
ncbi:DUF1963 domain-containing protein [Luedemannella flava]